MNMDIDEARRHDQTASVERVIALATKLTPRSDLSDQPIFEEQVVVPVEFLGGIDDVAIANGQTGSPQIHADER